MLFSEDYFQNKKSRAGNIEIICGSMFSGKTEELIRRLKRAQFAKLSVEIFKPIIDVRYGQNEIISHDSNSIPSVAVQNSIDILNLCNKPWVIGIDEAQFFDDQLPEVCTELANRGIRVIVAGLDMDYLGNPFGPIPNLMAIAEHVTKVHAVCVQCGSPANYSYRTKENNSLVLIGEKESYEPRCRNCYFHLDQN